MRSKYYLYAAFAQLVFSFLPTISKFILESIPILYYIAFRWTISGITFGLLSLVRHKKIFYDTKTTWQVVILGIFGFGFASVGTLNGLNIGGVSYFSFLSLCAPFFVILLSLILLKEKLNKVTIIASIIAAMGIALIIYGKIYIDTFENAIHAALFVGMAYFFEGIVFLTSKTIKVRIPLFPYLCIGQCSAALMIWCYIGFHHIGFDITSISPGTLVALLFVALFSCVICYSIWYTLLSYLKGQQLAFFEYLHGIFAALWGILIFNEPLEINMIFGSVLLFLSILVVSRQKIN